MIHAIGIIVYTLICLIMAGGLLAVYASEERGTR